jgi:sporulation related protein
MPPQQQWGPPQPDPQGYELAYQTYTPADPGPFQSHHQQQGYGEPELEYGDDYYEDEEPRRGKRWILITVALVGAIGVGGVLAYGYRSFIAPHSGRVPVVKADPNLKAKPDFRSGKEFTGAERRPPVRMGEEQPPQSGPEPGASSDEPPAENLGPRVVKSIPIVPGGAAAAPDPAPAQVPGITLYRPPQLPGGQAQQAPTAAPPPAQAQAPARAVPPAPAAAPPSRVAIGSRPQPAAEADEEAPAASPPVKRSAALQTAAVSPRPPAAKPAGSGLGYVAVLFTEKTSMDALKKFADMQQKYTDVLVDKTPDVQEADLSDRGLGTGYRLVVGPPGSRNAASGVCAQLKSAGYSGCWVKEY